MFEWALEESPFFAARFRRYQKKHPAETLAVMNNLDTYLRALQAGVKPAQIQAVFIHREPMGIKALDQRGAAGRPRQTRLYIYTVEVRHTVFLITIGDKNSQKRDIAECQKFVRSLREEL